jgi:hypothetical protein
MSSYQRDMVMMWLYDDDINRVIGPYKMLMWKYAIYIVGNVSDD